MMLLKLIFHINAIIKKCFYKLVYGNSIQFGNSTTFRKSFNLLIDKTGRVIIGSNCFFNNNCSINAMQSVQIGAGSIFGENVKIYDHNHIYTDKNIPIKEQGYTSAPILIGKHCWIASNVIILKGVKIGDNCVIGAGCLIYKDIPDNTIVKCNVKNELNAIRFIL